MVKSGFDINWTYENALTRIKHLTGLEDLSLIEKVALRKISAESLRMTETMQKPINNFPPDSAAAIRFMEFYYDTNVVTQESYSSLSRFRNDVCKKYGEDRVGWYFQCLQDEMHLV